MNGELLVRTYDVGFGDCIFVRIPDADDAFHILIDCGTCSSTQMLRRALEDMRTLLPDLPSEDGATDLECTAADMPFIDTMLSANQQAVRLPLT